MLSTNMFSIPIIAHNESLPAFIAQVVEMECPLEMKTISAAAALKEFPLPLEFCAFSLQCSVVFGFFFLFFLFKT